jgi:hypothetical protein
MIVIISSLLKKSIFRLLKNAQMQGSRGLSPADQAGNPEEGGVLGCTLQLRRMKGTQQMGVFQQPGSH